MPRHLNPREMDKTRAKAPRKRGVVSSIICDKSLYKVERDKPRTSEDRQHHTTMSQINKMGSTRSSGLFKLTADLWQYCMEKKGMLTAEHYQGTLNIKADKKSRIFKDSSNGKMKKQIFQAFMTVMGQADIDLFADRTNHQLNKYIWKSDPTAMTADAFTIRWDNIRGSPLPQFAL